MSISARYIAPLALSFTALAGSALAEEHTQTALSFSCDMPDLSELSLPELMENIMPANVLIETTSEPTQQLSDLFERFLNIPTLPGQEPEEPQQQPPVGLGSGFIIDRSGIILTNNHVIEGAAEITVSLYDPNTLDNIGEQYIAKLIGTDPLLDLAVLKIDVGHVLPCVNLGDSNEVRRGDTVFAIGNPLGQAFSLSSGLISHTKRLVQTESPPLFNYFQTDTAINRGNSGGGLYDEAGDVIGINVMILSPNGTNIGLGMALQSNDVREVADEIIQNGKAQRAGLGVQMAEIDAVMAATLNIQEDQGVKVESVLPGGPAALGGILAGDVILGLDDLETNSTIELTRAISSYEPGDVVTIKILRGGIIRNLEINLTDRNAALTAQEPAVMEIQELPGLPEELPVFPAPMPK